MKYFIMTNKVYRSYVTLRLFTNYKICMTATFRFYDKSWNWKAI